MGKTTKPLSDTEIKRAKVEEKDYALYDGSGLQLTVRKNGSKIFEFRYKSPLTQKPQKITIGKYPIVTLAGARETRAEYQKTLLKGMDPKEERVIAKNEGISFKTVTEEYRKHIKSELADTTFKRTNGILENELLRVFANKPIKDITRFHILALVREIEERGHIANAKKVLAAMTGLLRFALSCGYIEHNVARDIDKGMLKKYEPTNHPHIESVSDLKELIEAMNAKKANPVIKLGAFFALHTFLRPSNVRFLKWEWIDFDNKVVTIPEKMMKTRKPHLVPLTDETIRLLKEAYKINAKYEHVFTMPSGKPLAHIEIGRFLKNCGYIGTQTAHGFRHTASTILHEKMNEHGVHSDAIERQMAHVEGGVKGVYNKAEYISDRIKLMHWWSKYLTSLYIPDNHSDLG